MATAELRRLETQLHNAKARQFRRDISHTEYQRLQKKISWLKQRLCDLRKRA
jgi:TATA-binding protein-associated factor Taf7